LTLFVAEAVNLNVRLNNGSGTDYSERSTQQVLLLELEKMLSC
jgi:hypothetical protein